MPDAVAVAVAKSVVARIESQRSTLTTKEFTLERSYADWDLDLSKMDSLECDSSLRVDVASHTTEQTTELMGRKTIGYTVPVDIAIRRKFGVDKQNDDTGRIEIEEIDALLLLTQELHLLLSPTAIAVAGYNEARQRETIILANPVREHLRTLRQFTSIIRLTFTVGVPQNV